jgi:hypothetical protein
VLREGTLKPPMPLTTAARGRRPEGDVRLPRVAQAGEEPGAVPPAHRRRGCRARSPARRAEALLLAGSLSSARRLARADGPPKATDLVEYDKGKDVRSRRAAGARRCSTFKVKDGWHVNAHVPHEDFLVPTVLDARRSGRDQAGKPVYPKPIEAKLSFSRVAARGLRGRVHVEVPLTAAGTGEEGRVRAAGHAALPVVQRPDLPAARRSVPLSTSTSRASRRRISATFDAAGMQNCRWATPRPAPAPGRAGRRASKLVRGAARGRPRGRGDTGSRGSPSAGCCSRSCFIFLMGPGAQPHALRLPDDGRHRSRSSAAARAAAVKALPRALVYVLGIALMYSLARRRRRDDRAGCSAAGCRTRGCSAASASSARDGAVDVRALRS